MSIDVLADRYLRLATSEFAGYSPLYEGLALSMSTDTEALQFVEPLGDPNQTPVRLFACIHDLTLAEPDLALARCYRELASAADTDLDAITSRAWPLFRALLFERADDLVEAMATHSIQTNEVGRVSALVPALTDIVTFFANDPSRRISLVEIGPSAGLNLFVDRYRVDYSDGRSTGPDDASVVLDCDVLGPNPPPLPRPGQPLHIGGRVGIDIAPLDVSVEEDRRWLEACVWPGLTERAQRLRDAMELARHAPPLLHRGNALELLEPVIDQIPEDDLVVVVSTWVLAYLSKPDRLRVHDLLAEIAATRDLAFVTAEYPQVTMWAPEPIRPPAVEEGKGATLLATTIWQAGARTVRSVAWMQAHGQWIDWLEA